MVPGRNPILMAKMLASLDVVSGGRCLPAFGLGIANTAEHQAFQVDRKDRAPWLNEALPSCVGSGRKTSSTTKATASRWSALVCSPSRSSNRSRSGSVGKHLRACRTGRLADGWLASFTTPRHVAEGIATIEAAAAEAGRTFDRDHYGVLIPYIPPGLDFPGETRAGVGASPGRGTR